MSSTLSICVFCGARPGLDPRHARFAREAGAAIAARGHRIVYGGGRVGLMGELAEGALAAGGEVVGIIPERLQGLEQAHHGLSALEVVPDMAARKTRMIELSDAFVALPGGLGTLDELFEVLTLRQLGYHDGPSALVAPGPFWRGLDAWVRTVAEAGFVTLADWARIPVFEGDDAMARALDGLEALAAR